MNTSISRSQGVGMDLEQQIKHKERMEKVVISSFQIIYLLSSPPRVLLSFNKQTPYRIDYKYKLSESYRKQSWLSRETETQTESVTLPPQSDTTCHSSLYLLLVKLNKMHERGRHRLLSNHLRSLFNSLMNFWVLLSTDTTSDQSQDLETVRTQ